MNRTNSQMMLALVLFGLLAVGCGPSPSDVCQKTYDLVKAEAGEAGANKAIGGDMAKCVQDEEGRKERQGLFKYKDNNKCLMSANTWSDVKECSKSK